MDKKRVFFPVGGKNDQKGEGEDGIAYRADRPHLIAGRFPRTEERHGVFLYLKPKIGRLWRQIAVYLLL